MIPIEGPTFINVEDISRRPRGILRLAQEPEANLSVFRRMWWGISYHEDNPTYTIPLLIVELPTNLNDTLYSNFAEDLTKLWREHYDRQGN